MILKAILWVVGKVLTSEVLTKIVVGTIDHLEKRSEKAKVAVEGDDCSERMYRVGERVRDWEDHHRARGYADAVGGTHPSEGDGDD